MTNLTPFDDPNPSSGVEIIDKAEPYVQTELEKMNGWYKWKVKVRVKGNDILELFRLVNQADEMFQKRYGAQDKKE